MSIGLDCFSGPAAANRHSDHFSLFYVDAERKLEQDEKPLIVQLNWSTDNREGHFVLKKDKETSQVSSTSYLLQDLTRCTSYECAISHVSVDQ